MKQRRVKRSLYHYSKWVETTFEKDGRSVLLPIRARAQFRGRRARGQSQILADGVWRDHMNFPWVDLMFTPSREQRDELGETIADAIIEHFETNDPEGLAEVLAESPEVEMTGERVLL